MSITRQFTHCLLRPEDVPPSQDNLEVVGVFNPAIAVVNGETLLLTRVAEGPVETRAGWIALPRWDIENGRVLLDWVAEEDVLREDTRSVRFKRDGTVRLTFASHLCLAWSGDNRTVRQVETKRFLPTSPLEEYGVEDPRITRIDDTYYITYVAISRHGPATMLVSTRDFRSFQRHGVIFCPDNKDIVLFPEKIGGRFTALHRPSLSARLTPPEIWLASSPDLLHWGNHVHLLAGTQDWECGRIGAGAPPVRTSAGWLELYHGNDRRYGETRVGRYSGGLLLLDFENPTRILGVSDAVFIPEMDFELNGFVPDVVFPTGLILQDDLALVYYGAADTVTAVTAFKLQDLLAAVRR
ncbi:MAG: putative glycosylase [Rariglobus sp.]|jgi:predicted GH43/DUF377 family glycosyl hydrolase|nr:putative glycosylase [Rariglobus sp.]